LSDSSAQRASRSGGAELVGDNLGLYRQRIETNKLHFVQPIVVKSLQKLLIGYPNWEIVVGLGREIGGLVIRNDEIVDGLRRENLPEEFKMLEYEGSRPQGSKFGDVVYSGSGPFSLERATRLGTAARAPTLLTR
jgi:hypothetical protein